LSSLNFTPDQQSSRVSPIFFFLFSREMKTEEVKYVYQSEGYLLMPKSQKCGRESWSCYVENYQKEKRREKRWERDAEKVKEREVNKPEEVNEYCQC
jgi:hypothetical protein